MRKTLLLSSMLASLLSLSAYAVQDQAIPDDAIGLSKTSVYDTPDPAVVEYGNADAGTVGKRAERSYMTAPPMIPHTTKDMVPITRDTNLCKDCHVQPALIGQKIVKGLPVPAPASHYVNVKEGQLYMGRWNCTQCHRPQAKVDVLVKSTFKKAGTK
ncbi:MAG TPA: nitrate reductase cytochrome c-type subunit [Thiobacillaceae bacterium]|nr:nitrate reductase cytochrome c-type subunit [Thiobacillaceae bacterium]HNF88088.1 nitrate reductase cytochrome c-type subunit [Thiobacillaceae bacterium]HNH90323.1 nitrate reductase cytochrome c-type subunit [Thiobacillaceae bacterium]